MRTVTFLGSRHCTDIYNQLLCKGTRFLDLLKRDLEFDILESRFRPMIPDGELGPCLVAYLLRVDSTLSSDGPRKGSIYADFGRS